jgi:Lrp/AsnC family transcriptional regulator, regulator for asnA, asnC and gidA
VKIDETTIEIMKHLKDGRKSNKEIADSLHVSENTVRSRVNKLRAEGVLQMAGLVEAGAITGHKIVIVGVKLNTMELVRKAEEVSKLKGVVSVGVVTGRYDLIMVVLLNNDFGLLEFYTQEMSGCSEGVQSTETFVVYKGFNLRVPYIL